MSERLCLSFRDMRQPQTLALPAEISLVCDDASIELREGDEIFWEFLGIFTHPSPVMLGEVVAETQALRGKAFSVRLLYIPLQPERGTFFVERPVVQRSQAQVAVA